MVQRKNKMLEVMKETELYKGVKTVVGLLNTLKWGNRLNLKVRYNGHPNYKQIMGHELEKELRSIFLHYKDYNLEYGEKESNQNGVVFGGAMGLLEISIDVILQDNQLGTGKAMPLLFGSSLAKETLGIQDNYLILDLRSIPVPPNIVLNTLREVLMNSTRGNADTYRFTGIDGRQKSTTKPSEKEVYLKEFFDLTETAFTPYWGIDINEKNGFYRIMRIYGKEKMLKLTLK